MPRALLCSLLLLACGGPEPESAAPSTAPAASDLPETSEARGAPDPLPALQEGPRAAQLPLPAARVLRVPMRDGLESVGELRPGHAPTAPLVVLVHQLSTDRTEWQPLLRRLGAAPALTTFAFDMRGHGESTQLRGRTVAWADFQTADWERVSEDVLTTIDYLREEEGLRPERVILVGSSIGSSAVLLAAAREPSVNALVALSPGRAYRGVDAFGPATQLGDRALLAIASRGEPASAETAQAMGTIAGGGEYLLVDGDRHGVGMFESAPESLERVVAFIRHEARPSPARVETVEAPAARSEE